MIDKFYISTRDSQNKISSSEGIIKGLAEDGGLYVPEFLDEIQFDLTALKDLDYKELATEILSKFLPDFNKEQIKESINSAYTLDNFDTENLVKLTQGKDNNYFLELWHGPTAAFKDMALTLLPYLLKNALKNSNIDKNIVILTATSGDTGKAALEGFKNVDNIDIVVFYPKDGVSVIQEKQMNSTEGSNTHVVSVEGNFDDTQNGVKELFNNKEFLDLLEVNNYLTSSANSINLGRLIPQVVYYYYSYFELVNDGIIALGEPVNFVVPSGNFGDILAGYYAKMTGLPIANLICASNKNNILTDFFTEGIYDTNRDFYKTSSPSMDILVSSNLERLIYDKYGKDANFVNNLMQTLKETGKFELDIASFDDFKADYANEDEVLATIKDTFESTGILIDPHTAVGEAVRLKLKNKLGDIPTIVLSTANPYKFSKNVYKSLYNLAEDIDEFELQNLLSEKTQTSIPKPLKDLEKKENLHNTTCKKEEMEGAILEALNIKNE